MPACAKCGREIPRRTAVMKIMKTGTYTDGGAFMRQVNLCPQCAAAEEKAEAAKKKQQALLLVGAVVLVAGAAVWFLFLR